MSELPCIQDIEPDRVIFKKNYAVHLFYNGNVVELVIRHYGGVSNGAG